MTTWAHAAHYASRASEMGKVTNYGRLSGWEMGVSVGPSGEDSIDLSTVLPRLVQDGSRSCCLSREIENWIPQAGPQTMFYTGFLLSSRTQMSKFKRA